MQKQLKSLCVSVACLCAVFACHVNAQTTAFTYQGKLTDAGNPAAGNYDLQFKLFDALNGGTQQGSTFTNPMVVVSNGIFTVTLDFGASVFPGANRWLEVGVRPAGSVNPYTVLAPRQPITSTPYAIQSLNATNAAQLGGVTANQYVTVTSGATSYIQNQNSGMPQPTSNFYISGNGTADGTLSGNVVNAATQFNLGGSRMLSGDVANGTGNTFAGGFAGTNNLPAGVHNSFFGYGAGFTNDTGGDNSYFGYFTGEVSKGFSNSFFGSFAGSSNTSGSENSFFGRQAGNGNTTGSNNAFFGRSAGNVNTTGTGNSFFGRGAGQSNSTGNSNAFFGDLAGSSNTAGGNSFFGSQAGMSNSTGNSNAFFGTNAGLSNTTGGSNSFFGVNAGQANTTSFSNAFFGFNAGNHNQTGNSNVFFGAGTGFSNLNGSGNSFLGQGAGNANTSGANNVFVGQGAGGSNTTANDNSFFGTSAGQSNLTGASNTFIGSNAGAALTTGSNNTAIGAGATIANGISNATAIGAGTTVTNSNSIVLGTSSNDVTVSGSLVVTRSLVVGQLLSVSSTPLCYVPSAGANLLATCSSSLRYKTNVQTFKGGLEIINRLRPISFTWKQSGSPDIGLGAEEVEKVEPLLTFHNEKGEIEGVRYTQLSAVFINSFKEQQLQIQQQQSQIQQLLRTNQQMRKRLARLEHQVKTRRR